MLTIKIKRIRDGIDLPEFISKGDWVDLRCAQKTTIVGPMKSKDSNTIIFNNTLIPLGIAMKMPDGFEAIVTPRSSTYKHYGIIQTNSLGVIDASYSGNADEWMMPVLSLKKTTIPKNDRICQFRIQLSQKATFWQKIKWLFSSKIKFEVVDNLTDNNRGGFGSTGDK